MITIRLRQPFVVKYIAAALGVDVQEVLKVLKDMGAPDSVTGNSTLEESLTKMVGLKFCVYIEEEPNEYRPEP